MIPRSPLPPRTRPLRKTPIKRKKRSPAETRRIYGPKGFAEFVKSLPCAWCGVIGYSQNAHVMRDHQKGMGRKAGWECITPLCGAHHGRLGCHYKFDERVGLFTEGNVRTRIIESAAATHRAWLRHTGASE